VKIIEKIANQNILFQKFTK